MRAFTVKNAERFSLKDIVPEKPDVFRGLTGQALSEGMKLCALFASGEGTGRKVFAVLSDAAGSCFRVICCEAADELESLANEYPQTAYFECELAERTGIRFRHHPGLRPVTDHKIPYEFFRLEGSAVHEVGVGPIHAGVIEPGHFRFQCHGETVYNLEIMLGYQKRGVNRLLEGRPSPAMLVAAESVAGDTVIGHGHAHCMAVETLSGIDIGLREDVIRAAANELERAAMNISGLVGIASDIGFAIVSSSYGRLRTLVINSLAELCGNRFGRGLLGYGGVRFDPVSGMIEKVLSMINTVKKEIEPVNDYFFSSAGAMLRFENVGVVSSAVAEIMGYTGPVARSCAIERDARVNYPYGAYRFLPVNTALLQGGDIFARIRLRAIDVNESLSFVLEQLENLPGGASARAQAAPDIAPDSGVISVTEGFRGEIMHIALTGADGINKYEIKDPSFSHWHALTVAMRNTEISDFPLCNKSFDLSYSGHDL